MNGAVLGLDIGGANLKAAHLPAAEYAATVAERPFALWRENGRLADALHDLATAVGPARRLAVTLTAELADCFASKSEGVAFVARAVERAFPGAELRFWGNDACFHPLRTAFEAPHRLAAANWLASAELVAREHRAVLLLDMGSTSTDIIPILGGRVAAQGRTDPERLRSGELVYTGALRTPACALVRRVRLRSGWHRVAAEWFAIAADVHVWLRHLPADAYTCDTPDGRGTSRAEIAARLARVVCADPGMLEPGDLTRLARHVHRAQQRHIAAAIEQVLGRFGGDGPHEYLSIGGGARLAAEAATQAGLLPAPVLRPSEQYTPAAAVARRLAEGLR